MKPTKEHAAVAKAAEERRERSLDAEIARRWLRERDESRAHGDALARAVDAGLAAGDLEAIRDALRRYVEAEAPALLGIRSLAEAPTAGPLGELFDLLRGRWSVDSIGRTDFFFPARVVDLRVILRPEPTAEERQADAAFRARDDR